MNDRELTFLLWRAGFGPTPEELETARRLGYVGTVDALLDAPIRSARPRRTPDDSRAWWVERLLETNLTGNTGCWPLQEKLTLFWHGHFTSSLEEADERALLDQNDLFRTRGAGRFADLLSGIARDPAMLRYLDNDENLAESPNENWGRELLELFTLGIGNYSEQDVKASARAFTGWGVSDDGHRFRFSDEDHDTATKTFLGVTGQLDGDDIVRLVATPNGPGFAATARNLCRRLYRFFAHSSPQEADLVPLLDAFTRTGGDLRATLRALFLADSFRSGLGRSDHIRSPVEWTIGAARLLGGDISLETIVSALADQGQDLFYPPNVGGWPGGPTWLHTQTQLARFRFAGELAQAATEAGLLPLGRNTSWENLLDFLTTRLTLELHPTTRAKLLAHFGSRPPARDDDRVPLLVQLVLITPEMQVW